MARKITKNLSESVIYILNPLKEFDVEDDGTIVWNEMLVVTGNVSDNKARILAQKEFGKEAMVLNVESRAGETYSLNAETFLAQSRECKEGMSYGHDTVTATFKTMLAKVLCFEDGKQVIHWYTYTGTTTRNKLLKAIRDVYGLNSTILATSEIEKRRWLFKDEFIAMARHEARMAEQAENEADTDTENEAENA